MERPATPVSRALGKEPEQVLRNRVHIFMLPQVVIMSEHSSRGKGLTFIGLLPGMFATRL